MAFRVFLLDVPFSHGRSPCSGRFSKRPIPRNSVVRGVAITDRGTMCNSTAFQCHNLTTEQCSALAFATGTTDVIIAAVSLSILLFVPFRMKRDACDSPTKRASLVLSLVLIISSLNLASVEFYNGFLPFGLCELVYFVYFSTRMAIFLYMVTIVGMLLIQVYSTVIYGCCNSMRKRLVIVEVAIHIIITVLSVVFSTGEEFFDSTNDLCLDHICSSHFDGTIVAYVILSLVVFILLCTVLSLVYVYVRYWKTVGIASRVRWTLLRCCIMLGILVADLAIGTVLLDRPRGRIHKYCCWRNYNKLFFAGNIFSVTANNLVILSKVKMCEV